MRATLAQLTSLQDLNRRVEQVRRDIAMLNEDVRTQERLVQKAQKRAETAHKARMDAMRHADAVQLQIEKAEEEIGRLHTQLNVTKQQKEYDAIQHSVFSHQADIDRWENEELEALQGVDEQREIEKAAGEQAGQAEAELARVKDEVGRQSAEWAGQLAALEAEQQQQRAQIDPSVLNGYDRLAVSHRKDPLAAVRGRICQGCFTQITKQTENRLMHGSEIVYCASCGRMLMLDQD